jgi:hypothetical protein
LIFPSTTATTAAPHCQHHESQRWLDKQQANLVPVTYFLVTYFLVTFNAQAELRPLCWAKQRNCFDMLLKTAWEAIDSLARQDPKSKGNVQGEGVAPGQRRP